MRPARFAPAALLGEEPRSLTRVACGETAIKEDILKRDASRLLLELETRIFDQTRIFDLSLFSVSVPIFGFPQFDSAQQTAPFGTKDTASLRINLRPLIFASCATFWNCPPICLYRRTMEHVLTSRQ